MHLSDGVLTLPIVVTTTVAAAGLVGYSLKGIEEQDIPRISLLTGAFFALSSISVPVGPSSVHLLLGGLLGILLGKKACIAVLIGLLLQLFLFQHGGLTTLGANMLLVSIPALGAYWLYKTIKIKSRFAIGFLAGSLAVIGTLILVILLLFLSNPVFGEGLFSVINILVIGHLPILLIEGIVTGFAIQFFYKVKPDILETQKEAM
ncbi:Substrate-specific component NikM of nickel ECF transporter [Candidatus Syntrophocurvum alkaliphilum]|uniref:Substrate-specific component NikM of nickel ECF transporter n=1 Tax=Candidatus Syntrophocurvum alkaliphilum TaxID=2293317 RepID=A0A6I6DHK7_9FIRM|nr:CbiM family transporter [Candidatus Syntrophocurvum alkaliphilum]QGU00263.1 Substrate-specific component NikM of nickel ECF transporter [Candidatus Syntrophocurvum alkaliphilum]